MFEHITFNPVPKTEPDFLPDRLERFRNAETERFKMLDTKLRNITAHLETASNRIDYRYWNLERSIVIELFTVKTAPNDTNNGIILTNETRQRVKRLRALQRSLLT